MTRGVTTNFGEPLSAESKQLVTEVRTLMTEPIHSKVYYFLLNY